MKRLALTALAASLAGLVSSGACADTINFSDFAFSNERDIAFNIATPGKTESVYAGEFRSILTPAGGGQSQTFLTYCVDLAQTFSWGVNYADYSLISPNSGQLSWFTTAKATDLGRLFTGYSAGVTDYVTSAAFQLATWAIISETGNYSVQGNGLVATPYFSGSTTQENLAINTAEGWLHNLPGYSNYSIKVEYSQVEQDMVLSMQAAGGPPSGQVPEPATYGLLAAGLGLIAFRRRHQPALATV